MLNTINSIVNTDQIQKAITRRQELKSRPTLIMEYKDNFSDPFSQKVRQLIGGSIIFTTRNLKIVVPSFINSMDKEIRRRVIYDITCPVCLSSYVGQTTRHLKTRLTEHSRLTAHVGTHFQECTDSTSDLSTKIVNEGQPSEGTYSGVCTYPQGSRP